MNEAYSLSVSPVSPVLEPLFGGGTGNGVTGECMCLYGKNIEVVIKNVTMRTEAQSLTRGLVPHYIYPVVILRILVSSPWLCFIYLYQIWLGMCWMCCHHCTPPSFNYLWDMLPPCSLIVLVQLQ